MSFFSQGAGACMSSFCFSVFRPRNTPLHPLCRWHSNCLWECCVDLAGATRLQKAVYCGGKKPGQEPGSGSATSGIPLDQRPYPVRHEMEVAHRGAGSKESIFFPFYFEIMSHFKIGRIHKEENPCFPFLNKKKEEDLATLDRFPRGSNMQKPGHHFRRDLCFQFTTFQSGFPHSCTFPARAKCFGSSFSPDLHEIS